MYYSLNLGTFIIDPDGSTHFINDEGICMPHLSKEEVLRYLERIEDKLNIVRNNLEGRS